MTFSPLSVCIASLVFVLVPDKRSLAVVPSGWPIAAAAIISIIYGGILHFLLLGWLLRHLLGLLRVI